MTGRLQSRVSRLEAWREKTPPVAEMSDDDLDRLIAFNRTRLKAAGENPDDEMRALGFTDDDFGRWDALVAEGA